MELKPCTNERLNFFKFCTLVYYEFPKVLRQIFINMWNRKIATRPGFIVWDDSAMVRNLLCTSEGGRKIPFAKSIEEWDCTALFQATIYAKIFSVPGGKGSTLDDLYLKKIKPVPGSFHTSVQSSTGNEDETYALAIDQLRLLRNTLCHSPKPEIIKSDFDHYVQLIIDALTAVNIDVSFVDAVGRMSEKDFPTEKVQQLKERLVEELQAMRNVDEKLSSIETMLKNISWGNKESGAGTLPRPHVPSTVPLFTGRQVEIEEITRLITDQSTQLLNIWGSPGFGKTSTAIEAARHLSSFGYPVYFFKFQGAKTIHEFLSQILSIFKSSVVDLGLEPVDKLVSIFREISCPIYLVFDNLDDILSSEANAVASLCDSLDKFLDSSSAINIIFTTRELLDTTHGRSKSVRIRALGESSSIDYVRQLIPKFSEAIFVKVARICSYVPLAMKLVSSLLGSSSEEISNEILEELNLSENILQQLESPHHESNLQILFDTLFEKLTSVEKHVLISLTVFSSAITHDAATNVASGVSSSKLKAVQSLNTLVNTALIDEDPNKQFFSIHPLIYFFVVEKAKQQDFKSVINSSKLRYFNYYCLRFERLNDDFLAGKLVDSPQLQNTMLHVSKAVRLFLSNDVENCEVFFRILTKSEMFLFFIGAAFLAPRDINRLYESAINWCKEQLCNDLVCLKLYVSYYFERIALPVGYFTNISTAEISHDVREKIMLQSDGTASKFSCYEGILFIIEGNEKSGIHLIREHIDGLQKTCDQQILKCLCLQLLALYYNDSEKSVFNQKAVEVCEEIGNYNLFVIGDEYNKILPLAKQQDISEAMIMYIFLLTMWSLRFLNNEVKTYFLSVVNDFQQNGEKKQCGTFSNVVLVVSDFLLAVLGFGSGEVTFFEKKIDFLRETVADGSAVASTMFQSAPITTSSFSYLPNRLLRCYMLKIDFQGHDKRGSSIETCREALRLSLEQYGKEHENSAMSYHRVGLAEQAVENYNSALDAFDQALRIYRAISTKEPSFSRYENIAVVCIEKGNTYYAMNKYQLAVTCFKEALERRTNIFDLTEQGVEKVTEVLCSLGLSLFHSDVPSSLSSLKQALQLISTAFPEKPQLYTKVIECHVALANVHFQLGNSRDGIKFLKDALEISTDREQERLFVQALICTQLLYLLQVSECNLYVEMLNRILSEIEGCQSSVLSNGYLLIGSQQLQLGNRNAALQSFQRSLDIELDFILHENISCRESSLVYHERVLLVLEKQSFECFPLADRISDRAFKLAESLPDFEQQFWLFRCYFLKGCLHYQNKKYLPAIEFFTLALSRCPGREITSEYFQECFDKEDIFHCYALSARAQFFQGNFQDALKSMLQALPIIKDRYPQGSYLEAMAYYFMADFARELRNKKLVVNNLRLAYKMHSRVLGENHSTTQQCYIEYVRALTTF